MHGLVIVHHLRVGRGKLLLLVVSRGWGVDDLRLHEWLLGLVLVLVVGRLVAVQRASLHLAEARGVESLFEVFGLHNLGVLVGGPIDLIKRASFRGVGHQHSADGVDVLRTIVHRLESIQIGSDLVFLDLQFIVVVVVCKRVIERSAELGDSQTIDLVLLSVGRSGDEGIRTDSTVLVLVVSEHLHLLRGDGGVVVSFEKHPVEAGEVLHDKRLLYNLEAALIGVLLILDNEEVSRLNIAVLEVGSLKRGGST